MSVSDAPSVTYSAVRTLQLEGTFPGAYGAEGAWPVSSLRVMRGWGFATEEDWPHDLMKAQWPPPEPPGIDAKAKPNRIHHYQRIRSADECATAMSKLCPVLGSFEITEQWFDAAEGIIEVPEPKTPTAGSHCISLLPQYLENVGFVFVNSWGDKWGNGGFGALPPEFFDARLIEAWVQLWPGLFPSYYKGIGIRNVSWGMQDCLGGVLHGREIYDGTNDDRIAWAFVVSRDGFLDVEEFFVMPKFRRQGYGRELADGLLQLARQEGRNLRLWVSFADCEPDNLPGLEKIVSYLGLHLAESGVRWAALKAVAHPQATRVILPWRPTQAEGSAAELLSRISMPERPAQPRSAPSTLGAIAVAASLAMGDAQANLTEHAPFDAAAVTDLASSSDVAHDAFQKASMETMEKYSKLYKRLASDPAEAGSEAADSTVPDAEFDVSAARAFEKYAQLYERLS